ncbi:unnamed protein product [Rotaria magnacalcarata]|uniref:DZF domain-containing protein n=2 Tax=Rotaria magnacalcarata TaxID=392030 RepID=A0A814XE40_9BILA|nr:unnamed protein product [Rotaria magnacalcarata]
MNYSTHNTLPYSQFVRRQSFYSQRFPYHFSQQQMPQYRNYPMYSSIQDQSQFHDYNYQNQSLTATLKAFTPPCESSMVRQHLSSMPRTNFNRRSRNNSSNSTSSTRMHDCETCFITYGDHNSHEAHLNGPKRKKNVAISQKQPTYQNACRCELCNINCTSSIAYKAHLDGTKHNKAVKLHRKLSKTSLNNVNPQLAPINKSQPVMINEVKQSNGNSTKLIGIEYIETSYDDTNNPRSYYCKLCDCIFNECNTRDAHLKGKRHLLSYQKKVNPKIQVDDNNNSKSSSPQQYANEIKKNTNDRQITSINELDMDDDTKYLMKLHEQIIPTPNLLDIIEQFVSTVEAAVKSCSNRIGLVQTSTTNDTLGTVINKSPLVGLSRIGALVKNLLIKSDRLFHIVVICTEWPTMDLFEKIFSTLLDNFQETWKNQINILCQKDDEIIRVYTNTIEGPMSVSISFTSLSIQKQQNPQTSEQLLSRKNCLKALYAINSFQWFQSHISTEKHAPALIRCLRYKTKILVKWKSLPSEVIEILIAHALSKSVSAVGVFRRVLEYLSSGLVLYDGPGLRIPWQTDEINNIFDKLTDQERNNITHEAQNGLRFMTFGKLNKWLEQYDVPKATKSYQKRPCSDYDNQMSAKRQCIESENIKK